ncbi:hypothetical protein QZH41_003553 [Actinostola sp. cb2023]|nr:hypothetical protein QZH41_003553 [Actinostola sp. cb2023]
MDINNNADKANIDDSPLTLGNLFHQDLKSANILSNYPTSFVHNYRFLNDKKYRIFDIQKSGPKKNNPFLYLYPGRICPIAGNEFPILMDKPPSDNLMAHWKKWLPGFPETEFKTIDEGIEDEDPIITIFPMQRIPAQKHAIEPEMHYHILLKSAIPETGAPCPKHFTEEDAVFPCMVKVDQSLSGYGNFVAYNQEELADSLEIVNEAFGKKAPYVITGYLTYAIGYLTYAIGYLTYAIGYLTYAIGYLTYAIGYLTYAIGYLTYAIGYLTYAIGYLTYAIGYLTYAIGYLTYAIG